MALTYAQQLKDPRWQRRRLERLSKADFRCELCCSNTTELHVHHPEYFKGRMAWEYEDNELEVLCKDCHGSHHKLEEAIKRATVEGNFSGHFLTGLVAGFLEANYDLDGVHEILESDDYADARHLGHIANLYFYASREAKAAAADAFEGDGRLLSPVDQRAITAANGWRDA